MQRTFDLPEEQLRHLEQLAARDHRSVGEVVELAISDYLGRHQRGWTEWGRQWDALVATVQAGMPSDVTPEEIEADITAARAEVRAERATHRAAGGPDVSHD